MSDKSVNTKLSIVLVIVVLIAGISVGNAVSGEAVRKKGTGVGSGTTTTISSGGTIQLVKGNFVLDIGDYAVPCYNGVKLENVGQSAALVNVNGVLATVDLYQTEIVNDCRITTLKLDYQPEIAKSSAILAMERVGGGLTVPIPSNVTVKKSEKGIYSMKVGDQTTNMLCSSAVILENVGTGAVLVDVAGVKATVGLGQSTVVNDCLITNVDMTFDISYDKSSAILAI